MDIYENVKQTCSSQMISEVYFFSILKCIANPYIHQTPILDTAVYT